MPHDFFMSKTMPSQSDSLYLFTSGLQPTRQAWQQAARSALAASDFSLSVAAPVLLVSRIGDGVLQRVIAEKLGVHPAALVHMLDQAEAAKLLERRALPDNRRARGIYLLPQGRRLALKMEKSMRALRKTLFKGIAPEDIETANRVMQAFETRARQHVEAT